MFRSIYLAAMGALLGAIAAAACGHPVLWLIIGVALGLMWAQIGARHRLRFVLEGM